MMMITPKAAKAVTEAALHEQYMANAERTVGHLYGALRRMAWLWRNTGRRTFNGLPVVTLPDKGTASLVDPFEDMLPDLERYRLVSTFKMRETRGGPEILHVVLCAVPEAEPKTEAAAA